MKAGYNVKTVQPNPIEWMRIMAKVKPERREFWNMMLYAYIEGELMRRMAIRKEYEPDIIKLQITMLKKEVSVIWNSMKMLEQSNHKEYKAAKKQIACVKSLVNSAKEMLVRQSKNYLCIEGWSLVVKSAICQRGTSRYR